MISKGRKIPNELNEIVEASRTVFGVGHAERSGGRRIQQGCADTKCTTAHCSGRRWDQTIYTRQTPYLWKDESPAWIHRFMQTQKIDHPSKLTPRRLHGSFGWQIMEPFKPGENDIVIDKAAPDHVIGNEFETVISNRRAHTIVMIGCTTDGGRSHGEGRLSSRLLYGRWSAIVSALTPKRATMQRSSAWIGSPMLSILKTSFRSGDTDGRRKFTIYPGNELMASETRISKHREEKDERRE